ncbi:hypothetical protein E2562_012371 [Oryza meyeriana var. granulata]|uniref:Uncharacterized protein n=1 Tax=Oryza meyeriana var. granulata TaxID=110450 RepID=A0A6G1C6Y6_9ORYZ|nr:hypothetical protein E2562_012371 [Oryza meyeriana var. granulata]
MPEPLSTLPTLPRPDDAEAGANNATAEAVQHTGDKRREGETRAVGVGEDASRNREYGGGGKASSPPKRHRWHGVWDRWLVVSLDAAVARLGLRCGLDFGGVYASLKASSPDARLDPLVAKGLKVKAKKMEWLVASTAKPCSQMEALDELEAAGRKLAFRGWSRLSGPIWRSLWPRRPPVIPPAPTRSSRSSRRSGAAPQGGVPLRRHGLMAWRRLRRVQPHLHHLRRILPRRPAATAVDRHRQRPDPAVQAAQPAGGEGEGGFRADHTPRRAVLSPPADGEQLVPNHLAEAVRAEDYR